MGSVAKERWVEGTALNCNKASLAILERERERGIVSIRNSNRGQTDGF